MSSGKFKLSLAAKHIDARQLLTNWAMKIGPATAEAVKQVMNSKTHPEQGFRASLGIIRLARPWGNERLEAACVRALELNACSYKYIKLILESGGDQRVVTQQLTLLIAHENVRGSNYYSHSNNEENEHANSSNNRELATSEADGNDLGFRISDANA